MKRCRAKYSPCNLFDTAPGNDYNDYEVILMKKEEISSYIRLFLAPVLVMVLGLILVINPDSATAFVSKILGTVIILIGIGFGVSAIFEKRGRSAKAITAVVMAIVGGWLVKNPLALAAWLGRFIGVLLVIDGLQDMGELRRCGKRFLLPLVVTVLGAVLILMPMTTSRLVFTLCGVVVLIMGAVMLLDRFRTKPKLKDSNIVDAE